jgi:hypothetical protein
MDTFVFQPTIGLGLHVTTLSQRIYTFKNSRAEYRRVLVLFRHSGQVLASIFVNIIIVAVTKHTITRIDLDPHRHIKITIIVVVNIITNAQTKQLEKTCELIS